VLTSYAGLHGRLPSIRMLLVALHVATCVVETKSKTLVLYVHYKLHMYVFDQCSVMPSCPRRSTLASSPGHSHVFNVRWTKKIGETGDEASLLCKQWTCKLCRLEQGHQVSVLVGVLVPIPALPRWHVVSLKGVTVVWAWPSSPGTCPPQMLVIN
jgi:hypothetical protein